MKWMFVILQNANSEAIHLNVIVFGDRAWVEVIKVKWSHKSEALISDLIELVSL